MHAKRSQDCHEGNLKGNSGETAGKIEESCKGSFHLLEYTIMTIDRNVNDKGHFGDVWVRNEVYVIG